MDDALLALVKKCDLDTNDNVNPSPSFVMAKKIQDARIAVSKEHSDMKQEKEEKRQKLTTGMKVAEASVGIGLGNIRAPQKPLCAVLT